MKKLKEKLSAKLSKNGGFTMVEMLIVVEIGRASCRERV